MVLHIMDDKDVSEEGKVDIAIKWCKRKLTTFRVDERRKVSNQRRYDTVDLCSGFTLMIYSD